jgi:hypothetical protein
MRMGMVRRCFSRPGIGLEMNDEAVKKMMRPGTPWFT